MNQRLGRLMLLSHPLTHGPQQQTLCAPGAAARSAGHDVRVYRCASSYKQLQLRPTNGALS